MKVDIIWLAISVIVMLCSIAVNIVMCCKNIQKQSNGNKAPTVEHGVDSNNAVEEGGASDAVTLNFSEIVANAEERALENSTGELENNIDQRFTNLVHLLEQMLDEKLKPLMSKISAPPSKMVDPAESVNKEKTVLEEKLKKEEERSANLQREKSEAEKKIHDLKKEVADSRNQISRLEEKIAAISLAQPASMTDDVLKKNLEKMSVALNKNIEDVAILTDEVKHIQGRLPEISKLIKGNFKGINEVSQSLKLLLEKEGREVRPIESEAEISTVPAEFETVKKELDCVKEELFQYKEEYDKVYSAYARFRKDVYKVVEVMVNAKDATSPEYLSEVLNECMNTLCDKFK